MKRLSIFVLLCLLMMVVAVSAQSPQEEDRYRTVTIPDLGTFTYPVDLYSVRSGGDFAWGGQAVFPGIISIEPNDSFLYADEDALVYTIQIVGVGTLDGITADNLEDALGKLLLLKYDPSQLRGLVVRKIEIGGQPAVQVENLNILHPDVRLIHIVAIRDGWLYEFTVQSTALCCGMPAFSVGKAHVNRPIYQAILDSFEFTSAS
jgi:hypothetical protein